MQKQHVTTIHQGSESTWTLSLISSTIPLVELLQISYLKSRELFNSSPAKEASIAFIR